MPSASFYLRYICETKRKNEGRGIYASSLCFFCGKIRIGDKTTDYTSHGQKKAPDKSSKGATMNAPESKIQDIDTEELYASLLNMAGLLIPQEFNRQPEEEKLRILRSLSKELLTMGEFLKKLK